MNTGNNHDDPQATNEDYSCMQCLIQAAPSIPVVFGTLAIGLACVATIPPLGATAYNFMATAPAPTNCSGAWAAVAPWGKPLLNKAGITALVGAGLLGSGGACFVARKYGLCCAIADDEQQLEARMIN